MNFSRLFVLCLLAGASSYSSAQQPGTVEYNTIFLPAHGAGDTLTPTRTQSWGAFSIATSDEDEVAMTGWAVDYRTEDEASRASLDMCARRGGSACEINLVFMNQCATVMTSDAGTHASRDRTLRRSRKAAGRLCGSNCRVLYEGCTSSR